MLLKLEGVQKNLRLAESLCLMVREAWTKIVLPVVAVALEADLENHSVATIKNNEIVKKLMSSLFILIYFTCK